MRIPLRAGLTGAVLAVAISATTALAAPNVVTSIKPVHSLVSTVMQGVGTPHLIVDGAASPHTFSLRPSSAEALAAADLVVWLGPELETFLVGSVETLAENATVLSLGTVSGLTLLDQREGGAFDAHIHGDDDHHDEAHEDHDDDHDEAHKDGEAHEHENHESDEHAHKEDHDEHDAHEGHESHEHAHGHEETDLHVWLDPENAKIMLNEIAHVLADADPENAKAYSDNAARAATELDALKQEIAVKVAAVSDKPFIVFHDAYQYFENRFGLEAAGSITVSPDAMPGVQRISEIREKIVDVDAACVFSEPQFEPRLISVVTEGTDAKSGVLDPLGAGLENGPNLYPELLRGLANSLVDCLSD